MDNSINFSYFWHHFKTKFIRSLHTFTELDKRFCFMAGTNLFMLTCGDYINNYIGNVKNVLKIDL